MKKLLPIICLISASIFCGQENEEKEVFKDLSIANKDNGKPFFDYAELKKDRYDYMKAMEHCEKVGITENADYRLLKKASYAIASELLKREASHCRLKYIVGYSEDKKN